MKTRSKRLESYLRISTKEQAARKRLDYLTARREPLERNLGMSEQGANRTKETRESENEEQTVRQRLENFDRDQRV